MATKTPYARQYGAAPQWVGLDDTHSGLTPLGPPRPLLGYQLDVSIETRELIEQYQKQKFDGFTTQMLVDMDAITNGELNPNDLNVPLNPLLHRHHWAQLSDERLRNLPPNYIPKGMLDTWSVSIDSVWNALLPTLRLVSVILGKIHGHPWFENLIIGDREPIHEDRLDAATKLKYPRDEWKKRFKSIKIQPAGDRLSWLGQEIKLRKNILMSCLEFDFFDALTDPDTKKPFAGYVAGLTQRISYTKIKVSLAWQEVAPLLRSDLTSSQRLLEQLSLAQVLLHEIIHAYHGAIEIDNAKRPENWKKSTEPYFGDEPASELGCSMENAFFGGIQTGFIFDTGPKPHFGLYLREWPNDEMSRQPTLTDPQLSPWRVATPIPVSYYEMMQSDDFWKNHFRTFGSIKPSPTACVSYQERSSPINDWVVVAYSQLSSKIQQQSPSPTAAMIEMNPVERAFHANKMRAASMEKLYNSFNVRNSAVLGLVDQGEICARYIGPPEDRIYKTELQKLLAPLGLMISRIVDCVNALKEVEHGREKQVDMRNNILSFQHNLRKFIGTFAECSSVKLSNSLKTALMDLEKTSVDLHLEPTVIEGHIDGAIREEQVQKRLLQQAREILNRGDDQECQNISIRLLNSLGADFQQRSWGRLLCARVRNTPAQQRQLEVNAALSTMRSLYGRAGAQNSAILTEFEEAAAEVSRKINTEDEEEMVY